MCCFTRDTDRYDITFITITCERNKLFKVHLLANEILLHTNQTTISLSEVIVKIIVIAIDLCGTQSAKSLLIYVLQANCVMFHIDANNHLLKIILLLALID